MQDKCMKYKCKKCNKEFEGHSQLANHVRWYHKTSDTQFTCVCGKSFYDKSNFIVHQKYCDGTGTKLDKKKQNLIWICPKCGHNIKNNRQKHLDYCDGSGPRRLKRKNNPVKKGSEEFSKRVSEGLKKKYEADPDFKKRISQGLKQAYFEGKITGRASTDEKEIDRRKRISESMKSNPACGGLRHGSGRGKKGWYKGYFCDSSWELTFVIYCLEHGISIVRNQEKFPYQWNNETHYYVPDFIMEDGSYTEIKGYRTEQVEAKINQFPKKLEMIDKYKIKKYLDYVVGKYGENFISLYE